MVEQVENIEDMRGHSVREWVSMQGPRQEIKNRFKQFLRTFIDDSGVNVFREKIKQMCEMNKQSLIVNYNILAAQEQVIILFILITSALRFARSIRDVWRTHNNRFTVFVCCIQHFVPRK